MSLSIGIVGLPNVGKSTLFSTLTKKQVDIANYPFCTIDPNVGVVAVPDNRVEELANLTHSGKKIYATIDFVDIAGLVKGANKGEGLGNKFLANIRETDAIVYVLRAFKNDKIINTRELIDPVSEKSILETELMLKDLETVEKVLAASVPGGAGTSASQGKKELDIILKAKALLEEGKPLIDFEERELLRNYQFLSAKPRLFLLNGNKEEVSKEIINEFEKNNWRYIIADVISESEAVGLNPEEREALGMDKDSELDVLIKKSYELLNLITFFTTGEDETRAWTIEKGFTAPEAGGVIHTDFISKFIKAEVVNWKDLIDAGGFAKAREKGIIRIEGKEYIVKDGDVIEIKHN